MRNSAQAHYGIATDPDSKDSVALIQVTLLEGVFTAPQKQEIIQRLTDAMVENMRRTVWCMIEEVDDPIAHGDLIYPAGPACREQSRAYVLRAYVRLA